MLPAIPSARERLSTASGLTFGNGGALIHLTPRNGGAGNCIEQL